MKIGLIQQHNTADTTDNITRLTDAIRTCAAEDASLIVLQELHNGLYFCQTEDTTVLDRALWRGSSCVWCGTRAVAL